MLTFLGLLIALGIFLAMIAGFAVIMRVIAMREKRELEQISGGHYHA